ncbi:hypothetical protein [Ferrovum myxofaciens]|uniref:hypothetical protein n=1 Tax=Ferrovum myxofaciens TaxID=416213 RepID=UPI0023557B42|nr:hypothetical protein [Ferrovum myxofaciens]MBU6994771.1 hypothetical protein [Ferrovum myxofaciens]
MTKRKLIFTSRRNKRPPTAILDIELPELSNEAAAALADVLVQLYHRFEAAYYAQILSHHADQLIPPEKPFAGMAQSATSQKLFSIRSAGSRDLFGMKPMRWRILRGFSSIRYCKLPFHGGDNQGPYNRPVLFVSLSAE